jgi:hypothetical protein
MALRVRLQIDAKTGEIAIFEVDQDVEEATAAHERAHDRASVRIAQSIGVRPAITVVETPPAERLPGVVETPDRPDSGTEQERERDREGTP